MKELDYSPALNEDGTEFDIVKAAEIAETFKRPRYRWTPDGMRLDPVGEYVLNHMVPPLASSPAPTDAGLRAAAQCVVASAEPDDNFDGEYIEYLVQADVLEALRAALASSPAPACPHHPNGCSLVEDGEPSVE